MLSVLRGVAASAAPTADRIALVVVRKLGPVATAIFKTATGLQRECPSEEELLTQVGAGQQREPGEGREGS